MDRAGKDFVDKLCEFVENSVKAIKEKMERGNALTPSLFHGITTYSKLCFFARIYERRKLMERRTQPIGFIVKQINNVYEKDLNERLKRLGITSSQCAVLDYLFHTNKEEVNQRDVERNLSLKNPTVTGILKRLDEKGFILCVPNATDKRKKNIYLTEKAYDIQRKMEADRRKLDRELTRGMTKKEIAALTRGLEKMLYNIADP